MTQDPKVVERAMTKPIGELTTVEIEALLETYYECFIFGAYKDAPQFEPRLREIHSYFFGGE